MAQSQNIKKSILGMHEAIDKESAGNPETSQLLNKLLQMNNK